VFSALALPLVAVLIAGEPSYPHGTFRASELGQGPLSYWLFEPADPAPEQAPVIVFLHGWLATNPALYGAWIEHLARRGSIVVFPRYYTDGTTHPAEYVPNARAAIRDALDVLRSAPGRVRPDLERFALIGHSAGGNLAALLAAASSRPSAGLPKPRAVLAVLPGEVRPVDEPKLDQIPPETLLVVVAADQDVVVGDARARAIFAGAAAIPPGRKLYVLFRTDRSGAPMLLADHFAPTGWLPRLDTGEGPFRTFQESRAIVDRLDRRGFWALADRTLTAAVTGQSLDEVKAGLETDLGTWPDGRPITPPLAAHDPAAIPRVLLPHGARLIPLDPDEFARWLLEPGR
jgi:dienelactone hydrolase